jgi:hypothetical protein
MTGVGGDIRKIARLLQKKAPPGHMLAYINQEEADLLKARGGSGEPHADTGVPSFAEEDYVPDYSPTGGGDQPSVYQGYESPQTSTYGSGETTSFPLNEQQQNYEALRSRTQKGAYMPSGSFTPAPVSRTVAPLDLTGGQAAATPIAITPSASFGDYASAPSGSRYTDENISGSLRDSAARAAVSSAYSPPTQDKDLLGQAGDWFKSLQPETKQRLGIASIQGLIGAYQSQQAAEQGRKAKQEMSAMAEPYQQQGKELIAKAQKGELSPVGQQQLQAVQAQAAQGAQARGGVGAQQAQAQVEAYRQQLLQGQYDYGLKIAGIGDQIMTGAIKTGMEADRYVNQLTSNYYTNIARAMYGQAPQVSGQQPAPTIAGQ